MFAMAAALKISVVRKPNTQNLFFFLGLCAFILNEIYMDVMAKSQLTYGTSGINQFTFAMAAASNLSVNMKQFYLKRFASIVHAT
jgi:hypothetical protein